MTIPLDRKKMGRAARRKGAAGENVIVQLYRAEGWPHAMRSFDSGATGGGDIVYGPADTHSEVRFRESMNVVAAYLDARTKARPTDTTLLIHKKNRSPVLVTLELSELLPLLAMREKALP